MSPLAFIICPRVSPGLEMNTPLKLWVSYECEGDQIACVLITLGDNICIKEAYLKLNQGQTFNIEQALKILPAV